METPTKCARCSAAIMDRELVYFDRGDLIHVRCWSERVPKSDTPIRESRTLGDRARRPEEPDDERGDGTVRT